MTITFIIVLTLLSIKLGIDEDEIIREIPTVLEGFSIAIVKWFT